MLLNKVKTAINLVRNMGMRYLFFRSKYELLRKSGLLKKQFPIQPAKQSYITLADWQTKGGNFFFDNKESLQVPRIKSELLEQRFNDFQNGKLSLFNSTLFDLGRDYNWVTNPDTNFVYDKNKHWTEIADIDRVAGDIKYVWEKSRFSFLHDIIRYDYHYDKDCAEIVFSEILSWIKNNPVNCGPNYRCSQEISLRVLNWTFALYYYRNSTALTEEVFNAIQYVIYWQMHHVYQNIDFSRIAVRNNHAITETLTLYLVSIIYPTISDFKKWGAKGKKWFEEEIAYQIYEDGTFLQFSMNYHRVVVQLLTWGIVLAEKNNEKFSGVVYERAKESVKFLSTCMIDENGNLPNYGANDGALFFKLNDADFRDYRPQLQALSWCLGIKDNIPGQYEDISWYGIKDNPTEQWSPAQGISSFNVGGYYIIREPESLTFIRCGNHKDRPSQADNLHIDIWYKGENILLDAGSYKYNTDEQTIRYFAGSSAHNTMMIDDKDQMLKGKRFIWYNWTQCVDASLEENNDTYSFKGTIKAFTYLNPDIRHTRTIIKKKLAAEWQIIDEITNLSSGENIKQLWHLPLDTKGSVSIIAMNKAGMDLQAQETEGWASSLYGCKEKTRQIQFITKERYVSTIIKAL